MLKPSTRAVGTLAGEVVGNWVARHLKTLWWLLAVLAAGVVGWVLG